MRELNVPGFSGRIVQGGADEVRPFYNDPEVGTNAVIVNCARRVGDAKVDKGRCDQPIYWLPMVEADKKRACSAYLETYGTVLVESLRAGKTIVVNCQEGLYRSVEFATQLAAFAESQRGSDVALEESGDV